jgi:hypothetical protein
MPPKRKKKADPIDEESTAGTSASVRKMEFLVDII